MTQRKLKFDRLIKNALVFDGTGTAPFKGDLAIRDGKVAAIGRELPDDDAADVVDAEGQWLMPGLLDIHTHYDLELELSPGLPESVRHGTTTVVVANCSLGLAFGAQRDDGDDPIVDCFARVENIPKPVLKRIADKVTWSDSGDYLAHLDTLKLGPNVVPMIPYSMLRIAAMGVTPSVSRDPNEGELREMERLLEKGMTEGYAGFSSDNLPFHYLANDPNREKRIPSQYAGFKELKRLTDVVRRYGRIWQATPPTDNPLKVFRTFLLTSGRFYKKALKITAVAALDLHSNRNIIRSAYTLARILNSPIVKGRFYLQSLCARFKVFSDGPVSPLAEEAPALRELMMLDLEDDAGRAALYADPAFEARFKDMWRIGKSGYGLDRIKRFLRIEDLALRRDISEMTVEQVPVEGWAGDSFADIFARLKTYQTTREGAKNDSERQAFDGFPVVADDADFVFHLFKTYDRALIWSTVSANVDIDKIRKVTMSPTFLPGFADSGAHLTNLAFYDVNLRALKAADETRGIDGVAFMVKRLTHDAAAVFGVDAGRLDPGAQADFILINPAALRQHDGEKHTVRIHRALFDHEQLVNRSDGVVASVNIAGVEVWSGNDFTDQFEQEKLGNVLRAIPENEGLDEKAA